MDELDIDAAVAVLEAECLDTEAALLRDAAHLRALQGATIVATAETIAVTFPANGGGCPIDAFGAMVLLFQSLGYTQILTSTHPVWRGGRGVTRG